MKQYISPIQQSISPIHPTLTTPQLKNFTFPQTAIQSTKKPSIVPKYSQNEYQTFRQVTKPRQPKKTSNRNNFSVHNCKKENNKTYPYK